MHAALRSDVVGGLRNTVQITRDDDVTPPLTRECQLLARYRYDIRRLAYFR
jgi:hypothetical protein